MLYADFIFLAALAYVVRLNIVVGSRIASARMPVQWGIDGKPNWYLPKPIALWGVVTFMITARLLIAGGLIVILDRMNGVEVGLAMFSIIVAVSHYYVLRAAVRGDEGYPTT